jgi:hypothetical protein
VLVIPENLAAMRHKRSFLSLPPPWPDCLHNSLDAVERPTPPLTERCHARSASTGSWRICGSGPISPQLATLADLV